VSLDTLSDFIAAIDKAGELHRITHPVRVHLELCEIADRVMKLPGGGPALLFEHPVLRDGTRASMPVAINLFGSMRRMSLALGVDDLDTVGNRITQLLDLKVPDGLFAKLGLVSRLFEVSKFPPRTSSSGTPACQEIVWRGDEVDLDKLPIITCWPEDGGPYVTLTMVISKDPARGIRNVGMYRVQQLGKRDVAMHWQRHKTGAEHLRVMAERGEKMPVCIAVGADPASMYSASAPLPPMIDEFIFAGFLRKSPVKLVKAVTCDLEVPADADLVIEGYIDPAEALVMEGPFGDHTGYYSEADLYPRVHVTAVTMRKQATYATTIVGKPPMEDFYLGHATERIFLPLLKLTCPEIVDYHMPAEGGFHNLVFVSIDKRYPGHADKVMHALWGAGLMSLAKVLVVLDHDVNVRNTTEAWWAALNNMDPDRDTRFTMGPVDVLDHASRAFTYGSKMGIDATRKWPEEGATRPWPKMIAMDETTKTSVDAMWSKLGLPAISAKAGSK
jgi:4-hydroxy-3-polyprenylbenzoate decarboxylase